MERNQRLIECLADGEWHSGEDLAGLLDVSRAAVWKRLQALGELGLELESRHGKGYRLSQTLELLNAAAIRGALEPAQDALLQDVTVFPSIGSTNDWLMQQGTTAAAFAEHQTAGRGRRGRAWCSPFGANLYFSLAWQFDVMPPQLSALSLAVGITLAESLGCGVGLKWPNDLLWQGRKLAGILIEHQGEASGPCRVVIGVGLNLGMTDTQGAGIDQDWVGLAEVNAASGQVMPSRNALAGRLLNALLQSLQQFALTGFDSFHPRWAALDVSRNQAVRIEQANGHVDGVAQGVDRNGALLVQVRGERQRFFSGEVSLRVKATA